jgi:D-threo-aldose 1-dehydrogenase
MEKVSFKNIKTSSLGFGCTKLTDTNSRKAALETLHTAFDLGITHFDTARLYGFGESEAILGDFIKDKRDQLTITTKMGLDPVVMPTGSLFLLKFAKQIVNAIPFVKKLIIKKTDGFVNRPLLTPEKAAKYLDTSLQKLQTDYIDILLLHEFDVIAANRLELIDFFKETVKIGKIRHFGIGTAFNMVQSHLSELNAAYEVIQIEHNLLNPNISLLPFINSSNILVNAHSIFKDLNDLKTHLATNKKLIAEVKKEIDIDISTVQNISYLLLAFNKYSNSNGISIFTSVNHKNISNNVMEWIKPTFSQAQVKAFSALVHNSLRS